MPTSYRHLRSKNHAPSLITLFTNFPEVPALSFRERRHRPVIDHQHIDAADTGEQVTEAAISTREGELAE